MKPLALLLVLVAVMAPLSTSLSANPKEKGEANALARRGTEAAKNRQWDEAVDDLRKATEMDKKYSPSLVAALLGRAATYASQQQFQEAASDYDEVLKFDSRNTFALEGRASVAMKMNDMDKAAQMYSDAIKAKPDETRYYLYRSYIYEVKGDLKNSMADTEKVLKLDKDNADAVARKTRIQARLAQAQADQYPPAPPTGSSPAPQGKP